MGKRKKVGHVAKKSGSSKSKNVQVNPEKRLKKQVLQPKSKRHKKEVHNLRKFKSLDHELLHQSLLDEDAVYTLPSNDESSTTVQGSLENRLSKQVLQPKSKRHKKEARNLKKLKSLDHELLHQSLLDEEAVYVLPSNDESSTTVQGSLDNRLKKQVLQPKSKRHKQEVRNLRKLKSLDHELLHQSLLDEEALYTLPSNEICQQDKSPIEIVVMDKIPSCVSPFLSQNTSKRLSKPVPKRPKCTFSSSPAIVSSATPNTPYYENDEIGLVCLETDMDTSVHYTPLSKTHGTKDLSQNGQETPKRKKRKTKKKKDAGWSVLARNANSGLADILNRTKEQMSNLSEIKDFSEIKKQKFGNRVLGSTPKNVPSNVSSTVQDEALNNARSPKVSVSDILNLSKIEETPNRNREAVYLDQIDINPVQKKPRIYPLLSNSDQILVQLEHPQTVAFTGCYEVKCLCGKVDINGYQIEAGSDFQPVYSLKDSLAIPIQTVCSAEFDRKLLKTLNKNVEKPLEQTICTLLVIKKLHSHVCRTICCIPFYRPLQPNAVSSKKIDELKNVCLELIPDENTIFMSDELVQFKDEYMESLSSSDKPLSLILCGGKNTGKSTYARYLVNNTLQRQKEIAFLELDVGQTEFTPPGCVSLTVVSKPLLGAPFTHFQDPLRSYFFGCVSPGDNPDAYMTCIKTVLNDYRNLVPHLSLIVNTCGWVQGLGLALLIDIIKMVKPDCVVQLQSSNNNHNARPLDVEFITKNMGWLNAKPQDPRSDQHQHPQLDLDYKHRILQSAAKKSSGVHQLYFAREIRDIAILAYFSPCVKENSSIMKLTSAVPYEVKWSDIALHVSHCTVSPDQILYSLNGSVVALCNVPETSIKLSKTPGMPQLLYEVPAPRCLGFGIVRGISAIDNVLYIITPVDPAVLSSVNALIQGILTLPTRFLLAQVSTNKMVPYIDNKSYLTGSQPIKARTFMARAASK